MKVTANLTIHRVLQRRDTKSTEWQSVLCVFQCIRDGETYMTEPKWCLASTKAELPVGVLDTLATATIGPDPKKPGGLKFVIIATASR